MALTHAQALERLRSPDLIALGQEADAARRRLHPEGVVSYLLHAHHHLHSEAAQALCAPALDAEAQGAAALRFTVEPAATSLSSLCAQLQAVRAAARPHAYQVQLEALLTAPQLESLASSSGQPVAQVMAQLAASGLAAIAFAAAVHPPAPPPDEPLELHRLAHRAGLSTTAVLRFAPGDPPELALARLHAIQNLQQETAGFASLALVASAPVSGRPLDGVTAIGQLTLLAVARLVLDELPHLQSIADDGPKVLQMGLRFGADDAGVVGLAHGAQPESDLRRLIRDAGFAPVARDLAFRSLRLP